MNITSERRRSVSKQHQRAAVRQPVSPSPRREGNGPVAVLVERPHVEFGIPIERDESEIARRQPRGFAILLQRWFPR
jgi:hypothetical protein